MQVHPDNKLVGTVQSRTRLDLVTHCLWCSTNGAPPIFRTQVGIKASHEGSRWQVNGVHQKVSHVMISYKHCYADESNVTPSSKCVIPVNMLAIMSTAKQSSCEGLLSCGSVAGDFAD